MTTGRLQGSEKEKSENRDCDGIPIPGNGGACRMQQVGAFRKKSSVLLR